MASDNEVLLRTFGLAIWQRYEYVLGFLFANQLPRLNDAVARPCLLIYDENQCSWDGADRANIGKIIREHSRFI